MFLVIHNMKANPQYFSEERTLFVFNWNCISSPWSEVCPSKIELKGGLLNHLCGAGNFGRFWTVCGEHELRTQ
jgi:hypothetical protein